MHKATRDPRIVVLSMERGNVPDYPADLTQTVAMSYVRRRDGVRCANPLPAHPTHHRKEVRMIQLVRVLGLWLMMASYGAAQTLDTDFTTRTGQVRAGLAALGLATAPPAYNALLFLERVRPGDLDFASGQLGAWGTPLENSDLYVEGFLASQFYTPSFDIAGDSARIEDVKWRSVSATGGIGWDFPLTERLSIRPVVNAAIGRITSNSDVSVADMPGGTADFIAGDAVEAFGYGGSLALDYAFQTDERQIEFRMRHARLRHVAIGVTDDPRSSTDTIATSAIARHRMPIPDWRVAGGRVRWVVEATYARYDGDTGKVLGLPWIARLGTGVEFETGQLGRYAPPRVRTMVRYVFGEDFEGIGFGAGLVF